MPGGYVERHHLRRLRREALFSGDYVERHYFGGPHPPLPHTQPSLTETKGDSLNGRVHLNVTVGLPKLLVWDLQGVDKLMAEEASSMHSWRWGVGGAGN